MSEIKASTIKYGEPYVTKVGGLLFSITNIEIPATEEEYVEGGFELKPASLGLTDGLVAVSEATGGTASTTGFGGAIWCNPLLALAKETYEESKLVAEGIIASIAVIKGKPFVRVYSIATAGIGKPFAEPKTSTKVKLGLMSTTVYAFGK